MKKILSIIVFAIILFGCSEEFLDRQPEDVLSPGNFYSTAADIKAGLVGVYATQQAIHNHGGIYSVIELMSDDATLIGHTGNRTDYFYKTTSDSWPALWNNFFKMIVDANNVIYQIDNFENATPAQAVQLNAYRGEACFLRALSYFYLVRLYGPVPMFTEPWHDPGTAFGIGRTPVDKVYNDLIIPDLEYAVANCYKKGDAALGNEGARATKGAALTILGKVYLTLKDHSNAASTLKKLIVDKEAGNYSLIDNYGAIFRPENKFTDESIYEINFNVAAGMPSWYFRNVYSVGYNLYKITNWNQQYNGLSNLMEEFYNAEDWIRYEETVDSGWHATNNIINPLPIKQFPDLEVGAMGKYVNVGTDYNFIVTRYADALLMYAEALMFQNQKDLAVTYINQVRARVNMAPITAADLNIDRMLHERRMELTFEGHRYFDLVRTDKAIEYIQKALSTQEPPGYSFRVLRTEPIPETQLILPIPPAEIEKDQTLEQNPGY